MTLTITQGKIHLINQPTNEEYEMGFFTVGEVKEQEPAGFSSRPNLDADDYPARLVGLVHIGAQVKEVWDKSAGEYVPKLNKKGDVVMANKIVLIGELIGQTYEFEEEDGGKKQVPYIFSREETATTNDAGNLYKIVEALLGKGSMSDPKTELGDMLNVPCCFEIGFNKAGTKNNVGSIRKLMKALHKGMADAETTPYILRFDKDSVADCEATDCPRWVISMHPDFIHDTESTTTTDGGGSKKKGKGKKGKKDKKASKLEAE